jgi:HSP20 family protein
MRGNLDYPFESLRDLDTLMRGLFQREGGPGTNFAPYGVDIREDADHIYVEAELPGFKKDEIDITLENATLTIAAERRTEHKRGNERAGDGNGGAGGAGGDGGGGDWLLNERRYTRFLRSFTLPPTVDEGSVQAKLNDGVLTITINKREETKPRKVKVG